MNQYISPEEMRKRVQRHFYYEMIRKADTGKECLSAYINRLMKIMKDNPAARRKWIRWANNGISALEAYKHMLEQERDVVLGK